MIDALKPAFTLFQFKDGGMSENLGGHAVIQDLWIEQFFNHSTNICGTIVPLSPLVPLVLQVQMYPPEMSQPKKFSAKKIRMCFVRE